MAGRGHNETHHGAAAYRAGMTSPHDEHAPALDGWRVTRHDTAPTWTADRRGGLTDVELEYGCQLRVTAATFGELEVRCLAEDIKRGIVQAAERMAERMIEAELQRSADDRTTPMTGQGGGINA